MSKHNSTTREERAQSLIQSGAVTLVPGSRTARVAGSGKNVYTVNRDGCTCPDFQKRGGPCKHQLAAAELCRLYRACRREAKATGRTRLPAALGRALVNGTRAVAPARTTVTYRDDSQDDLFNPVATEIRPAALSCAA